MNKEKGFDDGSKFNKILNILLEKKKYLISLFINLNYYLEFNSY